jgi:hypothetical protein
MGRCWSSPSTLGDLSCLLALNADRCSADERHSLELRLTVATKNAFTWSWGDLENGRQTGRVMLITDAQVGSPGHLQTLHPVLTGHGLNWTRTFGKRSDLAATSSPATEAVGSFSGVWRSAPEPETRGPRERSSRRCPSGPGPNPPTPSTGPSRRPAARPPGSRSPDRARTPAPPHQD